MPTAKALQKIKHIKHVKNAIKYHEAVRAKKAAVFQERFDQKLAKHGEIRYRAKYTRGDIKQARRNYKEDWAMGPLRPNRAVGENAELYGAFGKDQLRYPEILVTTQREKNKLREKAGLDPEWPIIINDKRVYPITKGDRVVIIRGKEMNRIGIVDSIDEDSHMVQLKDVNTVYVDADIYRMSGQEETEGKRKYDFPFGVNDLRLVVPMSVFEIRDGRSVKVQQDVIVDNVTLEPYVRGINPYTGVRNLKNTIPEEYRVDPETNEPIYHRYIAGTRYLIDWPSNQELEDPNRGLPDVVSKDEVEADRGLGARVRGGLATIMTPFRRNRRPATLESGLFSKFKSEKIDEAAQEIANTRIGEGEETVEDVERKPLYRPRNIEREPLLSRPGPGYSEASEEAIAEDDLVDPVDEPELLSAPQYEQAAPQEDKPAPRMRKLRMKPKITATPQQVVWELERQQKKKNVFQSHMDKPKLEASLLEAIGKHMESNGVKSKPRRAAESEVD